MSQLRKGQGSVSNIQMMSVRSDPSSLLFSFAPPSFSFSSSFQNWLALLCYCPPTPSHFFHYHSCPALFAFLLHLANLPWPHSQDYEEGEINIKWTKVWERLHKMRHSSWKIVWNRCWILNTTTAEGWGVNVHENSFYDRRMFTSCSL